MRPLRLVRLWQLLGLLGVCLLIQQSLTSSPPDVMALPGGDKLLHFSAYAILTLWFGCIYLPGKVYLQIGAGMSLLGVTLEILQNMTGYRSFDYSDLISNFSGVMGGWVLARTRASTALMRFESFLMHSRN